ncbi:hypothetical protein [Pontimicrobium sp. MEBiC01747]
MPQFSIINRTNLPIVVSFDNQNVNVDGMGTSPNHQVGTFNPVIISFNGVFPNLNLNAPTPIQGNGPFKLTIKTPHNNPAGAPTARFISMQI